VQRAAAIAWGEEEHVVQTRARYAAKREIVLPAFERLGLERAGGDASFFLWLRVGGRTGPTHPGDAEAFALRLLDELGIVVAPGPFFGPGGEGHVRAALVPTLDECRRAAELLGSWR
jgi:aspartate/methionine/tyrosine aminotransferase